MNTRRNLAAALILGMLLVMSACRAQAGQASGQDITVAARDYNFQPANVTVKVNQPVHLTLRNTGTMVHDWTVQGMDSQITVTANPGQSASVQFTPVQTGTFQVLCTQPGHEQLGMVGQLVVQQ
jgi:plastocyanin